MIYRFSMPCDAIDALDFLCAGQEQPRAFFSTADGKMTFAGFGHACEGVGSLDELEAMNDGPAARLFGGFAFDGQALNGAWSDFPAENYWLYEVEYLSTAEGNWITINSADKASAAEKLQTLLDDLPHFKEIKNDYETLALIERTEWMRMVEQAVERIHAKDVEKVVLARPLSIHAAKGIDPLAALAQLNREYPNTYRFLIEPQPGTTFLGATPEQLVKVQAGALETSALAGSAPRGETIEDDMALAGQLLESGKNRHEHQLVVDAMKMQLEGLTDELDICATPLIHALPNVQHLNTPIKAKLKKEIDILDVVQALHPTPALGGMPNDKAMLLINELEAYPRGWYGAPIGWFDAAGNGEFVVAIRSAVISNNTAWAYAGAGIVADSDPATEWEETQVKFMPMLSALGVSDGN